MPRLPERLEGDGLLIRRWLVEDAPAMQEAIAESADHLTPWSPFMTDEEPQSLEQRRAMIERWGQEWSGGGDVHLAVFSEGQVAGSCGLHRRRGPGVVEIGYWTHRAFLRRGIATAVARALTGAAFSEAGIEIVEIRNDKGNKASAGVPRRLGFRLVEEAANETPAPADRGVDCVWQMPRAAWRARS